MNINRSEVSRALAKAIAYKECGKHREAEAWAGQLIVLLDAADILTTKALAVTVDVITPARA